MLEEYCLVKHRRNGSTIYQCNNYTHYMKVGDKAAIQREVFLYQTIERYWFPLPALLEHIIQEDSLSVMKEASLWGNLFANIFTKDCDDLGYDTITAITQNFWFPVSGWELNQQHYFTQEQIDHYLTYCARREINFLDNDIFATLFLMRGIFATVKTLDTPLLHDFRYERLTELCKEYLSWQEDMLTYFKNNYRVSL